MKQGFYKAIAAAFALTTIAGVASAQPAFAWARTVGGTFTDGGDNTVGTKADAAGNVYQVTNVLNGVSPNESVDIVITKYNAAGVLQWTRTYDRAGFDDVAYSMDVSPSGNVYVTGFTSYDTTNTATDIVALGFSTSNVALYAGGATVVVPASNDSDEYGYDCAVDGSGNLFIAGEAGAATSYDAALIRVNPNGSIQFRNVYPGAIAGYDALNGIAVAPNGEVGATGIFKNSATVNDFDAGIVRISNAGALLGQNSYNSADGVSYDLSFEVAVDNTGTYAIGITGATVTGTTITQQKGWIRKINNAGVAQYTSVYDPGATGIADFVAVAVSGGEAFIAGWSTAAGTNATVDLNLFRASTTGTLSAPAVYNSAFNDADFAADIVLNANNQAIVVGTIDKDALATPNDRDIVLVGFNRTTLAQAFAVTYNNLNDWDVANQISLNVDGSYTIGGFSYITFTDAQGLAVKYTGITRVNPFSVTILGGSALGGSLSSLFNSDNNRFLVINDENDAAGEVEMRGTSPSSSPSSITVLLETISVRDDQSQFSDVWNFNTNSWDNIDFRISSLTDSAYSSALPAPLNRYVGPGNEMRIKVLWIPSQDLDSGDGWSSGIDQAVWDVQ